MNFPRLISIACLVLLGGSCTAYAQDDTAKCAKLPQGDWSVTFRQFNGPGSESAPYQIISMKLEACNGYLYLSKLQLDGPQTRPFFTVELSSFVARAEDAKTSIAQAQVFRLGNGDGDLDPAGNWRTPVDKRWGTPLAAGSQGLLQPWVKNGELNGDYIIAVGISFISFGNQEAWYLSPPDDLKDRNKALFNAA